MVEYNIEGTLLFQPASFRFFYHEKEIQLSQKETEVLQLLCRHQQQVVERKRFMQEVWGDKEGADTSLNKSILTLRRKFESLGYLDAINTVPRVGYMLRLNALAIEVAAAEKESVAEPPELTSQVPADFPAEGKKPSTRHKRSLPYLSLIVAGLLSVLLYRLYALYIGKEASPLAYKTAYKSPSLTILEMADLRQSVNYPMFISHLPSSNNMQVSISNTAISLLGQHNSTQSWVRVFIKEPGKDINDQLTCIADYAKKDSFFSDKKANVDHANSNLSHDDTLQIKRFYSPCLDGGPHYLGDVSTTLSHYSNDLPKATQPSSWIQNVLFHDDNNKLVFNFQVIYRATYLDKEKDTNNNNFVVRLSQRTIKIGHVDQDRIKNNSYFKMIFNEYEHDDIFVKSLSSADGKSGTVLSSVFDGTLSHGLNNKVAP